MDLTFYQIGSIPLEEVGFERLSVNDLAYNEVGKCFQKVKAADGSYYMRELCDSVLIDGELMHDLTIPQLELFWVLSKNKRTKWYHEDKDNSKREELL